MAIISFRQAPVDTVEPYETLWFRLLITVSTIAGFFTLVLGGGHALLVGALKSLRVDSEDWLIQLTVFMVESSTFTLISMLLFAFIFSHPKISSHFGDAKKLKDKLSKTQELGK